MHLSSLILFVLTSALLSASLATSIVWHRRGFAHSARTARLSNIRHSR